MLMKELAGEGPVISSESPVLKGHLEYLVGLCGSERMKFETAGTVFTPSSARIRTETGDKDGGDCCAEFTRDGRTQFCVPYFNCRSDQRRRKPETDRHQAVRGTKTREREESPLQ